MTAIIVLLFIVGLIVVLVDVIAHYAAELHGEDDE